MGWGFARSAAVAASELCVEWGWGSKDIARPVSSLRALHPPPSPRPPPPHTHPFSAPRPGLLQVWDTRRPGHPTLTLSAPRASSAASPPPPLTCLDVHAAQSYCCATGSAEGEVAVWDLRAASSAAPPTTTGWGAAQGRGAAACCCVPGGGPTGGGVLGVAFDATGGSIGGGSQRVAYCTGGGALGLVRDAGAGDARLLYRVGGWVGGWVACARGGGG